MSEEISLDIIGEGIFIFVDSEEDEHYQLISKYRAAVNNYRICFRNLEDHDNLDRGNIRIKDAKSYVEFGKKLTIRLLLSVREMKELTEKYAVAFHQILQRIGTKDDLLQYIDKAFKLGREKKFKFYLINSEVEYRRRVLDTVNLLLQWYRKQQCHIGEWERLTGIVIYGEDPDRKEFRKKLDREVRPLSLCLTVVLERIVNNKSASHNVIENLATLTSVERNEVDLEEYHKQKLKYTAMLFDTHNLIVYMRKEKARLEKIHGRREIKKGMRKFFRKMDYNPFSLRKLRDSHCSSSKNFIGQVKLFERKNYRYAQYRDDLLRNEETTDELRETFKLVIDKLKVGWGIHYDQCSQIQQHPMLFMEMLMKATLPVNKFNFKWFHMN